jgi:flagellin-like hook-associated protein FlgL
MRVTRNVMSDTIARYLSMHNDQLFKVQLQIASQKRINKPSDDPAGLRRILDYRNKIATMEQYRDNIGRAKSRLELTELTLGMANDVIKIIREIALVEADGTTAARKLAAEEIRNLYRQLEALANTKLNNNYLFSGHQTDTPAFGHVVQIAGPAADPIVFGLADSAANVTITIQNSSGAVIRTINMTGGGIAGENTVAWDGLDDSGVAIADGLYQFKVQASDGSDAQIPDYSIYNGDSGAAKILIGERTTMSLNADGSNIFSPKNPDGTSAGVDVFAAIADLIYALENDDVTGIIAQTEQLDEARSHISEIRAANSPKMYQLENTENFWANYIPKLEELLAADENVDLNEAVLKLKNIELAYQTTLATAARIIQPGLIDFLK